MMSEANNNQQDQGVLKNVEQQVSDVIDTLEEQDAQVWAYLIGGVVALLVGLIAAYYYAQTVRERRKSTLEKVKQAVREGLNR
jgi:H+/gluconate symporter-like permease